MFEHISRIIPYETAITILIITLLITFIHILFAGQILDHYMAKREKRNNRQQPADNFFQPLAPPPNIEIQMDAPRAFDGLPLAKQFSGQNMIFNEKDMPFWNIMAANALRTAGLINVMQPPQGDGRVPVNIAAGHDGAAYTAITSSVLNGDQREWFMRNVAKFADSGHKLWNALLAEFGQTNIAKVQANMAALNALHLTSNSTAALVEYLQEYQRLRNLLPAANKISMALFIHVVKTHLSSEGQHMKIDQLVTQEANDVDIVLQRLIAYYNERLIIDKASNSAGTLTAMAATISRPGSVGTPTVSRENNTLPSSHPLCQIPYRYYRKIQLYAIAPCHLCKAGDHCAFDCGAARRSQEYLAQIYADMYGKGVAPKPPRRGDGYPRRGGGAGGPRAGANGDGGNKRVSNASTLPNALTLLDTVLPPGPPAAVTRVSLMLTRGRAQRGGARPTTWLLEQLSQNDSVPIPEADTLMPPNANTMAEMELARHATNPATLATRVTIGEETTHDVQPSTATGELPRITIEGDDASSTAGATISYASVTNDASEENPLSNTHLAAAAKGTHFDADYDSQETALYTHWDIRDTEQRIYARLDLTKPFVRGAAKEIVNEINARYDSSQPIGHIEQVVQQILTDYLYRGDPVIADDWAVNEKATVITNRVLAALSTDVDMTTLAETVMVVLLSNQPYSHCIPLGYTMVHQHTSDDPPQLDQSTPTQCSVCNELYTDDLKQKLAKDDGYGSNSSTDSMPSLVHSDPDSTPPGSLTPSSTYSPKTTPPGSPAPSSPVSQSGLVSLMMKVTNSSQSTTTTDKEDTSVDVNVNVDTMANIHTGDKSVMKYMTGVKLFDASTPASQSVISGVGSATALGTGILLFTSILDNGLAQELELKNVYIVDNLRDIIGVTINMSNVQLKLCKNDAGFVDTHGGSYVQLPTGGRIPAHMDANRLPYFKATIIPPVPASNIIAVTVRQRNSTLRKPTTPTELLQKHIERGHLPFETVLDMDNESCTGPIPKCPCMELNMRREKVHTVSLGEFKNRKPGSVLFFDLKGPMPVSTTGETYILSGVDNSSTEIEDSPMKLSLAFSAPINSKNDAIRGFRNIFNQMRAVGLQVGPGYPSVVCFTDNGKGEFRSKEIQQFFADNSIVHRSTAPESPQYNRAERHWAEIIPALKALMGCCPGGVPKCYWPHVLQHVERLRFFVPRGKGLLSTKEQLEQITGFHVPNPKFSPTAMLFSKVIAHHSNATKEPGALASTAFEGIYLGTEPINGTAKVLNPVTLTITESRNVTILDEYTNMFRDYPNLISNDRVMSTSDTMERLGKLNPQGKRMTAKQRQALLRQEPPLPYNVQSTAALSTTSAPELPQPNIAPVIATPTVTVPLPTEQQTTAPPACTVMASVNHFAEKVSETLTSKAGDTPKSMLKMLSHPHVEQWKSAYAKELEDNIRPIIIGPLSRSEIPEGSQVLNSLPQFKVKTDSKHEVLGRKVRLVLDGSKQEMLGSNYAPTVSSQIVKTVLSINATDGFYMKQIDVSGAFRYSPLDPAEKPVYFRFPKHDPIMDPSDYYLLTKSSYGLRNAPIMWYKHFTGVLQQLGLTASVVDPCL